ncbi:MAG: putative bifunctional diguanylate cyclase/phosphodiesterase, partial [Gemmatimonadaceae bacterium]
MDSRTESPTSAAMPLLAQNTPPLNLAPLVRPVPSVVMDPLRLDALRRTALLGTGAEPAFDRLTRLATRLLGVPVALVSLVDTDRQFFKSCIGLPEPWASERQTPLSHSFSHHTVAAGAPFIVNDAREHPLVRDNLAIPDLGVIAYAGIPLVTTDGHTLGSFCAIDSVPHHWTNEEIALLSDLAAAANSEIQLRLAIAGNTALRASEARFRAVFDYAAVGIAVADVQGRILETNPAFGALLGYTAEELRGRTSRDLSAPEDAHLAENAVRDLVTGARNNTTVEIRYTGKDGQLVWGSLTLSRIDEAMSDARLTSDVPADAAGIVGMLQDVTARKTLEAELTHQAFHDALTGLANRALFLDRVAHALARAPRSRHRVAVLFLDLDNFKTVNDSLGHVEGDRLLIIAARRLATCVRAGDTIARLGGDEFAVLVEDADVPGDAIALAERITAAFSAPFPLGGSPLVATASVGIATSVHSATPDALLRNADAAMYRAKSEGKGRYAMFEPAMHVAALMRLQLDSELRQAIDSNEFEVEYQPIVRFDTGRITAVEALVRWRHPERGMVAPGAFIAAAEDTGIIVPLGRWVLHQACVQAQRWRDAYASGPPLGVTVNLSGQQLRSSTICDDVRAALDASGLDPARLVLEITESVLMQHTEVTLEKLRAFKSLGVRLAIDDFGTGYSSLAYLQRFPIDILKIDKAFVDGVADGDSDAVIARTILALGKALGLRCVAEGVETIEQRDALRALGCEYAQGSLFAPSLSPHAVSAMVRAQLRGGG